MVEAIILLSIAVIALIISNIFLWRSISDLSKASIANSGSITELSKSVRGSRSTSGTVARSAETIPVHAGLK